MAAPAIAPLHLGPARAANHFIHGRAPLAAKKKKKKKKDAKLPQLGSNMQGGWAQTAAQGSVRRLPPQKHDHEIPKGTN